MEFSSTRPALLRFAPSPNGPLHLGHAYSALLNLRIARMLGGQCLLRIEDIDTARCTPNHTRACLEDLAWLGLTWPLPVRIQSEHFTDYTAAFQKLKSLGVVYPCFCSRAQVAEASPGHDPEGAPLYGGHCRDLTPEEVVQRLPHEPHSWRLDMRRALEQHPAPLSFPSFLPETAHLTHPTPTDPARWGDVILVRKDTPTSYHLSVVVDDALQNITHVVRGLDLLAATDIHRLLQEILGLPVPSYHHHPLLTDEEGAKLAKRRGSPGLADLRAAGANPQEIIALLMDKIQITN